jgi:hypothetical protein
MYICACPCAAFCDLVCLVWVCACWCIGVSFLPLCACKSDSVIMFLSQEISIFECLYECVRMSFLCLWYICMYLCLSTVCEHICTYVSLACVPLCVCIYVTVWLCIGVWVYVCLFVHVDVSVSGSASLRKCVYISVCLCTYTNHTQHCQVITIVKAIYQLLTEDKQTRICEAGLDFALLHPYIIIHLQYYHSLFIAT